MEASTTPPEGTAPEDQAPQEHPDAEAGPHVEPIQGDQGPQAAEQDPADALAPQSPDGVRVSAPPPEAQSGVPALPENADVEPQPEYAGPVSASPPSDEAAPDQG